MVRKYMPVGRDWTLIWWGLEVMRPEATVWPRGVVMVKVKGMRVGGDVITGFVIDGITLFEITLFGITKRVE